MICDPAVSDWGWIAVVVMTWGLRGRTLFRSGSGSRSCQRARAAAAMLTRCRSSRLNGSITRPRNYSQSFALCPGGWCVIMWIRTISFMSMLHASWCLRWWWLRMDGLTTPTKTMVGCLFDGSYGMPKGNVAVRFDGNEWRSLLVQC